MVIEMVVAKAYKRTESVHFRLTKPEADDVELLMKSGEYANVSEIMRDALRKVRIEKGLIKYG